jgi:TRAP-type C4-dicarboxylate transport system permease large subunit
MLALLIIGCLVEVIAALIMLSPIIFELSGQLGLDPLHVAMVFIATLVIGGVTPPVGGLLFVSCGVGKTSIDETLPFIPAYVAIMVFVVLLMILLPQLALTIPRLFS